LGARCDVGDRSGFVGHLGERRGDVKTALEIPARTSSVVALAQQLAAFHALLVRCPGEVPRSQYDAPEVRGLNDCPERAEE
jgi:hypothetical protein